MTSHGENQDQSYVSALIDEVLKAEKDRPHRGRPRAGWHNEAFEQVNCLMRDDDLTFNKACAVVSKTIAPKQNIEPETVRTVLKRYGTNMLIDKAGNAFISDDEVEFVRTYELLLKRKVRGS